jgi:hypothetical protein
MLTDFGIAAIADDPSNSTSDALIGSPEYMPPERTRNEHQGLASDLWSLGATLYAAVEGTSPFHRPTVAATLTAIAVDDPKPPAQAGPLGPLLTALLRKNPADRPSARDAAKMLRAAASGAYGRASIPAPDVREGTAPTPDGEPPAEESGSGNSLPDAGDAEASAAEAGGSEALPAEAGRFEASPPEARGSGPEVAPADRGVVVAEVGARPAVQDESAAVAGPVLLGAGRRWLTVAAVVLAVCLAAGTALWVFSRQHQDRPNRAQPTTTPAASLPAGPAATASAGASGSASQAAPSSPASSAQASKSPGLPALPPGWHDYRDRTGFAVYVPDGWSRSRKGSMVYFRGDGRVLGVDQTDHPKSDPLADWEQQSSYRVSHGYYPGYHRIRLVRVDYFKKSADWEYTFDDGGTRQHVANRNVLVSSSKAYGIYWQTTDAQWPAHRDDLALIYDSFRPA